MSAALSIAILAHSTNPRGGVVHAMELGDALARRGHRVVLHAPDPTGRGFFRATLCEARPVPARAAPPSTLAFVEARIADYVAYFASAPHRRFDVFHAHDGISGNALATLMESGLIGGFARTVHHVDTFAEPRLGDLQARSISAASEHFVVSRTWREALASSFGIEAAIVGNGVDRRRYQPQRGPRDDDLRRRLGLGPDPVFLAVGGIEARKNTIRILQAFAQVRRIAPGARLVLAGGASLLDHGEYRRAFERALRESGVPAQAVIETGTLADGEMPALYRLADTLVFPSLREGFGLAVLEALASGIPVVTGAIAPFTEYLGEADAVWCDPLDPGSIANAMAASLAPDLRAGLIERGMRVAARHDWAAVALAHASRYERLREAAYA